MTLSTHTLTRWLALALALAAVLLFTEAAAAAPMIDGTVSTIASTDALPYGNVPQD